MKWCGTAPRPVAAWVSATAPLLAMRGRLAPPGFALRLDASFELTQQSDRGVPGARALLAPLALTLRLQLPEAMTRLAQYPRPLPPRNAPLLLDSLLEVAEAAAHPSGEVAQRRRKLLLEASQRARGAPLCALRLLRRALRTCPGRRRCQDDFLPAPVPMQSTCRSGASWPCFGLPSGLTVSLPIAALPRCRPPHSAQTRTRVRAPRAGP